MVCRDQYIAARTVRNMNCIDGVEPEQFFHLIDCAVCLENTDGMHLGTTHQPIQSGHGRVVVQQWCIHENHGFSGCTAHHNTKLALWYASDKTGDVGQILVSGRNARKKH
jgi:hypothetical protein